MTIVDHVIHILVKIKQNVIKDAEFDHFFKRAAVSPCALFHCQLQEVVATDGWFLWVTSEVVPDWSAGETEIKLRLRNRSSIHYFLLTIVDCAGS